MARQEEVKVLGNWASPFVYRVEWALKLKGVEYEYIEEDIFNKSPLLLQLNPVNKQVPVLVHNGKAIFESLVILDYIDETWKHPLLLPRNSYEKAQARFWAKFAEEKLFEAARTALCSQGDEKERAVKLSIEALEKIEGELKGNKFFAGESIGYFDLTIGWIPIWLPIFEEVSSMKIVDNSKLPDITTWMNNFLSHPVIKEKLPPRDKLITYVTKRVQEITSAKYG